MNNTDTTTMANHVKDIITACELVEAEAVDTIITTERLYPIVESELTDESIAVLKYSAKRLNHSVSVILDQNRLISDLTKRVVPPTVASTRSSKPATEMQSPTPIIERPNPTVLLRVKYKNWANCSEAGLADALTAATSLVNVSHITGLESVAIEFRRAEEAKSDVRGSTPRNDDSAPVSEQRPAGKLAASLRDIEDGQAEAEAMLVDAITNAADFDTLMTWTDDCQQEHFSELVLKLTQILSSLRRLKTAHQEATVAAANDEQRQNEAVTDAARSQSNAA